MFNQMKSSTKFRSKRLYESVAVTKTLRYTRFNFWSWCHRYAKQSENKMIQWCLANCYMVDAGKWLKLPLIIPFFI